MWNGEKQDNFDIYVRLVTGGEPLRLTTSPEAESTPKWSPDGSQIAFRRGNIYAVPALGGAERLLADGVVSGFDWHPDGDRLVLSTGAGLQLLSLQTGQRRQLTTADPSRGADRTPAFSPDGNQIVFTRSRSLLGQSDIVVIPTAGGEVRPIVQLDGYNYSPVWTRDGEEIVFYRQWSTLFRVPASGGKPVRIPDADDTADTPHFARSAPRLVYSRPINDMNIWGVPASSGEKSRSLIASTRRDFSVAPSPDGQRLAFTSDRSGNWEIWTSDQSGGRQNQLTSFGNGAIVDGVRWSPDGRSLVFSALIKGNRDIYLAGSSGGVPQRLTTEPSDEGRPSFSAKGDVIYFRSNRGGTEQIWSMARTGGPARQVTTDGGFDVQESADGGALYFTKARADGGLWQQTTAGGPATPVPGLEKAVGGGWALSAAGIYWLDRAGEGSYQIKRWNPATKASEAVTDIDHRIWFVASVLSATPDGKHVFWHQDDESGADLVMLDNFR